MVNYQFSYILVMQIVGAQPIFANELKSCQCVAISYMELKSGFLSLENFKAALSKIQRQPKQECIKDIRKCCRRPMQLRNDAFAYSSISSVLEHFEKEIRVPLQGRMECGETGSYEAKRQAMSLHVQQEKTRRLSKMPEEVRAEISPWFIEKLAIHEDVPEKISKLDSNAKYVNSNLKPKRSDLVMNQHVNNVKYVRWMLETIPDQFLESHQLSGIILEYRRECGSSNIVQSLCEPAEDGILNSGLKQNNDMSPLNRFSLASEIM
ncbi:hypothetical protein D5086_019932 [Populus alba]|uniref:Uncharacterized protein n=1 Tax=Populus alba TaxID=43335 RepID=A0ACC4BIK7_POPAL